MIKTLFWKNNRLFLLNQKLLPHKTRYVACKNHMDVTRAIMDMVVRGAPAIGITAAFGMALAGIEKKFTSIGPLKKYLFDAADKIATARPTAVNLTWAIDRMKKRVLSLRDTRTAAGELYSEAKKIWDEDVQANKRISTYGAGLLKKNSIVLTHCNAGALATGGIGTALGVISEAFRQKKIKMVYVDETRPYLQGARLTAFELKQQGIPMTLITDNMAGYIMKTCNVSAVIVGADRIAANGDTANKIGTYSLAVLASYHGIPFYVAAPSSTIDKKIKSGAEIPVEERSPEEVTKIAGIKIAPDGINVRHPAFDVTPAKLITAIITEKGVFGVPYSLGVHIHKAT